MHVMWRTNEGAFGMCGHKSSMTLSNSPLHYYLKQLISAPHVRKVSIISVQRSANKVLAGNVKFTYALLARERIEMIA